MDKFYLILMTCARLPAGKRIRVRVPFRTISTSRFSLSKRQIVFPVESLMTLGIHCPPFALMYHLMDCQPTMRHAGQVRQQCRWLPSGIAPLAEAELHIYSSETSHYCQDHF